MKRLFALAFLFVLVLASEGWAKSDLHSYSFQWKAFAPNAGGQDIYALRRSTDFNEISLIQNSYLLVENRPLLGAAYHWRYAICGHSCFLQAYAAIGTGLSTAGPYAEISWTLVGLWLARLEFSTQMFATRYRMISWSIPAWVGISVPLGW